MVTLGTQKNQRSMDVSAHVHVDALPCYKCVIFLRNNYNFDIPAVANALLKRYIEIKQKESICKPCHKQLKDGKHSNNVQNCGNYDLFGSNVNHEQDDQDTVHGSRTHNENNMTCHFPSQYMTQNTTLTNYCMCICCHKTDTPRLQCIIFKESKYNFGNAVV